MNDLETDLRDTEQSLVKVDTDEDTQLQDTERLTAEKNQLEVVCLLLSSNLSLIVSSPFSHR